MGETDANSVLARSLLEMNCREGIRLVLAVVSTPGQPARPSAAPDAGPQPIASSFYQLGDGQSVAVRGFDRVLNDGERALVEARYPGLTVAWSECPA